jgi:hypothetical protein
MGASAQRDPIKPIVLVLSLILGGGCRGRGDGGATSPTNGGSATTVGGSAESPSVLATDPCMPQKLGLTGAKVVPLWKAPIGCQPVGAGGLNPPTPIHDEAEFKQAFSCSPDVPSGIDFGQNELLVSAGMLSPAGVGARVVDDGKTTTIISLFRSPCPSDYPPMPVPFTLAYLMPVKSARTYAESSCTFPPDCK